MRVLKDLNERDGQPAADFAPQLTGAHFHKHLQVLEHGEPGEQPLLGDALETSTGSGVTLIQHLHRDRSPWTSSTSGPRGE